MQEFHIAIVDDEPDLHAVIKLSLKYQTLDEHSLVIHSAYNKSQAVELIEKNPQIGLIFLDVVMESENAGFEFLTQLRQMPLSVQPQVILLTGQPGRLTETEATNQYDINAYLSKPDLSADKLGCMLTTGFRAHQSILQLETLHHKLAVSKEQQLESIKLLNETETIAQVAGWVLNIKTEQIKFTAGHKRMLDDCFNESSDPGHDELKRQIIEAFQHAQVSNHQELDAQIETGSGRHIRIKANNIQAPDSNQVYGAIQDVSKYVELLNKQSSATSFLNNTLNALTDALVVTDVEGKIITCNPATCSIFGYLEHELIGLPVGMLIPEVQTLTADTCVNMSDTEGRTGILRRDRTLPAKKKDGTSFPIEITISHFQYNGKQRYIGVMRNVSEKQKAENKIYRLAYTDSVTNLPNLSKFNEHLSQIITQQPQPNYLALMLIDLSGFYRINQAFGHDVGDQLLVLLADRINWVLPNEFNLFRAEGTDFLICCESNLQSQSEVELQLVQLSKQIFKILQQDIYLSLANHQINAHIGLLSRAIEQVEQSKLLHQLEIASHRAKSYGRNKYCIYDQELEQEYTRTYLLEQALAKAVENNELELYLQPQFNQQQVLICSEALVRWNSKKFGRVSPVNFIPLAEETGLIVNIGRWIFTTVCDYLAQSQASGLPANIAVNISAREILQPDFVDFVLTTLKQYKVSGQHITLELTESTLATDIEQVVENMKRLSQYHIRFSIDDFGTGYSSLSYLQKLPLHELKIDKSFIDDITDDLTPVPIVDTIVTMAKSLKLDLVAEGVEFPYQKQYLSRFDNVLLQGYLHCKPLPYYEWLSFLKKHKLPGLKALKAVGEPG